MRRQEARSKLINARELASIAAKKYMDDPSHINKINRAATRRLVKESEAQLAEWTAETEGTI